MLQSIYFLLEKCVVEFFIIIIENILARVLMVQAAASHFLLVIPQFDGSHVESVLGLWLSINLELAGGKYTASLAPTLPLTPRAVSALLAAVVRWVLGQLSGRPRPVGAVVVKRWFLMCCEGHQCQSFTFCLEYMFSKGKQEHAVH